MSEAQNQKAQALQAQYNKYQEDMLAMQTQLGTLTSQILEHAIVDKTLSEIDPAKRAGRKCFKMVGGVLVDKTVDEVIQILNDDMKVLRETKDKLEKSIVDTRKEMDLWMKNNNVKIVRNQ